MKLSEIVDVPEARKVERGQYCEYDKGYNHALGDCKLEEVNETKLRALGWGKVPTIEDCDLCKKNYHHPSEHYDRVPLEKLKIGDVIFVRAIITAVDIQDYYTTVRIKEYCGYRCKYTADVNSVDVFPAIHALLTKGE